MSLGSSASSRLHRSSHASSRPLVLRRRFIGIRKEELQLRFQNRVEGIARRGKCHPVATSLVAHNDPRAIC